MENNQESGTGDQDKLEKYAGTEVKFVIPNTEELGLLKDMVPEFDLRLKYRMEAEWKALKGVPIKCFFMGLKQIPNENGEMVTCGLFVSATEPFLASGRVLIEAIVDLKPKTPVQLTYLDTQQNRTNENSTMIFDVQRMGLKK